MVQPRLKIALLIALLMNAVILLPMLKCGYNMDDLITTCGSGFGLQRHVSVLSYTISDHVLAWAKVHGRFFPLAFQSFLFFSVIRSLLAYRVIDLVLVLVNVLLFGAVISRATQSRRLGVLSILLVPLMFEFRYSFDPFLSFCLLMQMTWGFLLGSFLVLDFHLEKARRWKLSLSLLLYVLAVLTYEVAWPFFVLHYLLIRLRRGPGQATASARRTVAPYVAVAGLFVVMVLSLRVAFHIPLLNKNPEQKKDHYAVQLSAQNNLTNVAKQLVAGLPLSYWIAEMRGASMTVPALPAGLIFVLGIGYAAGIWLVLGSDPEASLPPVHAPAVRRLGMGGLCLLGCAVMVLPTLLISLSAEHLRGAPWGTGYLPVYISYFGAALLLLTGLALLMRMLSTLGPLRQLLSYATTLAVGVVCAFASIVDYRDNVAVVKHINDIGGYHRMMIQEALANGLFQGVSDGAPLWTSNRWPWEHENIVVPFFLTYTGVRIEPISCGRYGIGFNSEKAQQAEARFAAAYSENPGAFYLEYHADDERVGFAVLARITAIAGDHTGPHVIRARRVRLYVRFTPHHSAIVVRGRRLGNGSGDVQTPFTYSADALKIVGGNRNGCLVDLPVEGDDIDVLSLRVNTVTTAAGPLTIDGRKR